MSQVGRAAGRLAPLAPGLRVIDILREHTPRLMRSRTLPMQVRSVLAKILLCRTPVLKGHLYECSQCKSQTNVYNSCTDRHCPQCGGAKRADWLAKSAELLLDRVTYFQVVFTLPDFLSPLILGNRTVLYNLLFQSAWRASKQQLRALGIRPAAQMVLHTWNQQLEHHPHVHALIPGGGPSLDGKRWINTKHRQHRRRTKPYLLDNIELGRLYRKKFISGLRKLFEQGKLKLEGQWSRLNHPAEREAYLAEAQRTDWNVFIEGPPNQSRKALAAGSPNIGNPAQVLKYLARYMTGGPIADSRILSADDNEIIFLARPKTKSKPGVKKQPQPYRLSPLKFMQRWTLHILPKGYTRSRAFGGYAGSQRKAYLAQCRELLKISESSTPTEADSTTPPELKCPRCDIPLTLVSSQPRPSWRDIFDITIYRHEVYSPMFFHLPASAAALLPAPYD